MIALPSAISQAMFPRLAWSFETADDHNNYLCGLAGFNDGAIQCSTTPDISSNDNSTVVVKKLHHNASERHRRKKMNTLYSSLRSLLPATDQMKKLSIPSTVARVVKYIPELQQEVHNLITKKHKLSSQIANHSNLKIQPNQPKQTNNVSMSAISLNRLRNGDLVIQIPAQIGHHCPLMSQLLLNLERDGLLPSNVSSFDSSGGTLIFYNLHFQAKEDYKIDNEKLSSLMEKKETVFRTDFGILQNYNTHCSSINF